MKERHSMSTLTTKPAETSPSVDTDRYPSRRDARSRPADFCATCGQPRGLSPLRHSWGLGCPTVIVPRTDEPGHHPWQITNDLIYNAGVWRNGGTNEETHLCNDCLRIGLRAIKLEVDELLKSVSEEINGRHYELAELTQRLGIVQHALSNLSHDHNRMQDRLKELLSLVDPMEANPSTVVGLARWEVARGHV